MSFDRIPLIPGRWYLGRDRSGREAVARLLMIDPSADKVTVTVVQDGTTWRRLGQRCTGLTGENFASLLVDIRPERFEPPAEWVAHPTLNLGRSPLPAAGTRERLATLADLDPGQRRDLETAARHGEGRPVWLAEEVCAITGASLAWVLAARGSMFDGVAPVHDFEVSVSKAGFRRTCRACGYADSMQGASPGWCHARETER